ncbi:MAG: NUDIX domain-containing protein, partial [Planctomycetota bacterium]|nr:NUDIX domain-containing protein [Planctomycetota bacterium]
QRFESLMALPGVGDYPAAAIASMAFDEEAAVIDGNVERVLSRFYAIKKDPSKGEAKKTLRKKAFALIKGTEPSVHNQAMMELGSLICRPGELAQCKACPISDSCKALAQDIVATLPKKAPRKKAKARLDRALAICRNGKILYGERKKGEVWGGLYELPRVVVVGDELIEASATRIGRELLGRKAHSTKSEPIATTKHGVMNEKITLEVYAGKIHGKVSAKGYAKLQWVSIGEIDNLALPSPQKKVARKVFAWWKKAEASSS